MFSVPAPDFSLQATLECGQAFRWHPKVYPLSSTDPTPTTWYYGFLPAPRAPGVLGASCAVKVKQDASTLTVETIDPRVSPELIRDYFALDLDLEHVLCSIDVDAQIHDAIIRHRGLRIVRQDPWECLLSFILSAFNNIKRIDGMIERLSQAYGAPVAFNGFRGCTFPTPERLAAAPERRLRELGLGFRAPYVRATARLVADGKLSFESLRRSEYDVCKAALCRCEGVGDKVADCVALFSLEKYEAFPIDVWMQRAMRYYFRKRKMTTGTMHAFARRHFGRYAGYAQQYLYHYVRNIRIGHQTSDIRLQPSQGVH